MTPSTLQTSLSSDQLVEQFIHSCSHDLRSPLSSIEGLVNLAKYYPQSTEVHNCFSMIEDCTVTMDKLIRALEEFMVINHYAVTPETINCDILTDTIIEEYRKEIKGKSIVINKKTDTSKPMITDRLIFSRIFKHLFSNAISFQDSRKRDKYVDIQIESENNGIKLQIKDNGIGIPSIYHQKIFRPFFKASIQSMGLGMGLFLLNNLLNKIKGSISHQSEEHNGTTVTVLIPCLTPSK